MTEHDGTLVRSGACFSFLSTFFASRSNIISVGCIVLFAVEGPRRTMAFEGFDAAMSRTRSPECRGRNRAVAEARPDRDDVSLPRGREWGLRTIRQPQEQAQPSNGMARPSSTCGGGSPQACARPP